MNSTLSKLAAHGHGRGLNRRRSLHEWWEDELISKEGGSNDETDMPEKGGRHLQGQQPGLESSGRPAVRTNSPKLDQRGCITALER